jgi:CRISPR/Cas system type I-B associated protein Csh2 (Cas7 group RAMP superfamily)
MTGVIVIEVRESNPNGDPDRESDPRSLPDKRGVISAVSFKRKLRDLVLEKDGVIWTAVKDEFDLNPDRFEILEDRSLDRRRVRSLLAGSSGEDLRKGNYVAFHERFWDARLFGNTFLEDATGDSEEDSDKKTKAEKLTEPQATNLRNSVRNGVVQIANAHSVTPVQIVRSTNTKKAGAQMGKDRGMAPLGDRRVLHGVYVMPFFVNPALAHKTHCDRADLDVFLRLIPVAYPATASRARPFVEVRHAFLGEHKSVLGSFSEFAFVDRFTPKRRGDPEQPTNDWSEYEIAQDLGPSLNGRVANFRDLVAG